jgi:hypothetical protein
MLSSALASSWKRRCELKRLWEMESAVNLLACLPLILLTISVPSRRNYDGELIIFIIK